MNNLIIQLAGGAPKLFALAFACAFIALISIYLILGNRFKFSFLSLFTVVFSLVVFFFVGMKMGNITSFQMLADVLLYPPDYPLQGKNAIMGLLAAFVALSIGVHWLKLSYRVLDPLAYAIPVAVIIQRTGCLFNGCCHGCVTGLPLAIKYGTGSIAWEYHYSKGLIGDPALFSMPVHPIPLYIIIASFFTLILVFYLRNKINKGGSLLFISV